MIIFVIERIRFNTGVFRNIFLTSWTTISTSSDVSLQTIFQYGRKINWQFGTGSLCSDRIHPSGDGCAVKSPCDSPSLSWKPSVYDCLC
ncbi:hypothetical protein BV898_04867 [Hypsibius exemplaris]|uniref:Uncharacterized protein n=1 Tax=Hypsibius exemplaris TaxID=2072580 RepID=A0A1W0X0Z1_HYPEX|nr:hypothetical protein BV898_04867 [Hypsibius exemplaris]